MNAQILKSIVKLVGVNVNTQNPDTKVYKDTAGNPLSSECNYTIFENESVTPVWDESGTIYFVVSNMKQYFGFSPKAFKIQFNKSCPITLLINV
jgi:hypothetical protein